jgi:hypothetical protein
MHPNELQNMLFRCTCREGYKKKPVLIPSLKKNWLVANKIGADVFEE